MKKLALLLAVVLGAINVFGFEIEGIKYNVTSENNRTVEVAVGNRFLEGDVIIPERIQYNNKSYTVTTIAERAFAVGKITSISIPSTVTYIDKQAFTDCNITSLTIPSSVRRIGEGAFSNCLRLKNVKISRGVQKIDNYAFMNCRNIKKITIPTSVTSIGLNAFGECYSLGEINIPASLPKLNYNGAFESSVRIYIRIYQKESDLLEYVEESHTTKTVTDVVDKVDTMPSFVGGMDALARWLSTNRIYPEIAVENGIMGTPSVAFVVEVDGTLRDIKIYKGVDPVLDKEAVRLIHLMPKWIPATLNGKPVAKRIALSVPFELE